MAPPGSHRKRRTAREAVPAEAGDALISLPRDVLDGILIRLGLRDAVRTSALSRAWRRRWESLPFIDISFHFKDGAAPGAVDGILLRYSGRVRSFNVNVDVDEVSSRRVQDWILVLSRRGVESLSLHSHISNYFALHSSVFYCGRLTSLDLFACLIPPLQPGFAGFPNLKNLILESVQMHEGGEYQLEEIIENSPLLEMLVLCEVYIPRNNLINWVIRAPNLRQLTICSPDDYGWDLVDLPRLRFAVIDLLKYIGDRDFSKFLGKLVNVTKLHLFVCYESSNEAKILETLPCTFVNLKSLKLYMNFCELPSIVSTFCLLRNAPNLEKLKILITGGNGQNTEANGLFENAQWTGGTWANLQIVQMIGINWLPNEMSFVELILSKASFLRTMSIWHGDQCLMSNEDALSELLKYQRASPQAQVLFKGRDDF